VREWLADRPGIVALAALVSPVAISLVGLGLAGWLPDVPAATVQSHFSVHIPFIAPESTSTPRPTAALEVVPPGRSPVRVPILEYHYIRVVTDPNDRLGYNLSVTPTDFREQMDWLQHNNYHPVDLNDLRAYFQRKPLPERPVVLTFDDGYIDFYTTAWPILQAHGFKAVSYVVPGFWGNSRYMSSSQIVEIDRAGVQIAAHTMTHADLTRAGAADLVLQVRGSKDALETAVGHPVLDFCYPSGKYNATVAAAVQQYGFQSATTEMPGTDHAWADRYTWTRVRVSGGERLPQFTSSLGTPEPTVKVTPGG
jgi:peptidoglycan/xylan/chitin deacetylase (PgdA/CDA1 family)